ncbi:T9SS type A sorting domain-containing protein [bacterium]|nr:T9SS type A sorting domain-containing protein [bacterium]
MKTVFTITLTLFLLTSLTAYADNDRILRTTDQQINNPGIFSADEDSLIGYCHADQQLYFWLDPSEYGDKYYNVRFTSPFPDYKLLEVHIPLSDMKDEDGVSYGGPIGEPGMRLIFWWSGEWADLSGYPVELIDSIDILNEDLSFGLDDENHEIILNVIDISNLNISAQQQEEPLDFHVGVEVIQNEENEQVDTLAIWSDFVNGEDRSKWWDSANNQWKTTHDISANGLHRYFNYAIWVLVTNEWNSTPIILEPDGTVRSILIDPAFPNPFNHQVNVNFSVKPGLPYTAILFDNQGRELQLIDKGIGGVGERNLMITGNGLAAGTYYLRVFAGNNSVSQRLIYLK